jgi:hypothetical protein
MKNQPFPTLSVSSDSSEFSDFEMSMRQLISKISEKASST